MALKLGSTGIGSLYLGSTKISEAYLGSVKVFGSAPALPPYTIRLKFTQGVTPTFSNGTAVQVSTSPNIWDLTYNNTSWYRILFSQTNLLEVIDANTTGVADMEGMFSNCTALTTVPLFDTSSVTTMINMFSDCTSLTTVPLFNTSSVTTMRDMLNGCTALTTVPLFDTSSVTEMARMFFLCTSLTTVPLFDTSSVTNMAFMFNGCKALTTVPLFDTSSVTEMGYMFSGCKNVQSGALALYQQASTQANPPSIYYACFLNCGSLTVTGAQELAQIPSSWGGTGA